MAADNREDALIQKVLRITDVADEPLEFLTAITGYEKMPIVSIDNAVDPLVPIIPAIKSQAYIAKMRCRNPENGLTQDESASIMLYTMEWRPHNECLYVVLNATLRLKDREKLKPWFLYLRLLFTALDRLPSISGRNLFRGVKLDLSDRYKLGETFVWWGFSSCTISMDVLRSELFLGKTGKRTMFIIECDSGKKIKNYSYLRSEDEVLILPATQFEVTGCLQPASDLYMIHLKEVQPPVPIRAPIPNSSSIIITSLPQNPPVIKQPMTIGSSIMKPTENSSTVQDINGQRNDNNLSQEKQSDQPLPIVHLSHEHNKEQQILRRIIHNWLGKEINYVQQLEKMDQQFNSISIASNLSLLIRNLIILHKHVCKEVEYLYERDHQPSNLTKQLTRSIEVLMQTLPLYDDYIRANLAPIRKALEKRMNNNNGMSGEDLLSIPPKQFLQILSQVQDLHKTAQSFESGDQESLVKLYDYARKCKLFGSRQDENINKIILKNEDVVTMIGRGTRDRCRLILYPDAIVCCNLKSQILASPKYVLLWFIPMIDLHWITPQSSSDDNTNIGDELKSNLKSAYKELEKSSNNVGSSHLAKNIRKQEHEYNLSQSKLELILSNSHSSISCIILFSSAYQRQDWIDLIDKTKQELAQRSSTLLNPINAHHQRITESLIQKRLDLVKPNLQEINSHESPSIPKPSKTYSGTLHITIHSVHGSALYNPITQQNDPQFYVAVEIDSYNTFYPYAQTAKQSMQQQDSVEFRGEVFQVELEHSLAFRLLIYRMYTVTSGNNTQRAQCIGKFHRNIETALRDCDCDRSSTGILFIESPNEDLKLKISLKYFIREGIFKRQGSKRSLAVFGRSIEKLISTPNGCIDGIPRIIVTCIQMVDRDGLKETGIYRVCCITSDLQRLHHQFDRNYYRGEEMLAEKNVHVAANLLKLFFRELPEPLFTSTYYKEFLHAIQLTDTDNQRATLVTIIESLNSDNRRILFYLLDHLIRVSQYSDINMMHLDNLAVVFGPILMRSSKLVMANVFSGSNQCLNAIGNNGQTDLDQMSSELQDSMHQYQVVFACLKLRRDGILK